ncbi:hypothetical protein, partial [Klebsiella aerogenes]|uniref:hypothetical protein n=1 Tax=Klebsiella aerogenes TaxID=548 RepID=UPI001953BC52
TGRSSIALAMGSGMFGLILTIIFLVIDIAISIWNSYKAGKIYAYRKGLGGVVYTLGGFLLE